MNVLCCRIETRYKTMGTIHHQTFEILINWRYKDLCSKCLRMLLFVYSWWFLLILPLEIAMNKHHWWNVFCFFQPPNKQMKGCYPFCVHLDFRSRSCSNNFVDVCCFFPKSLGKISFWPILKEHVLPPNSGGGEQLQKQEQEQQQLNNNKLWPSWTWAKL